jgi:hypothetical protein
MNPNPPDSPRFYMTCERRERIQEQIEAESIPVMQNVMLYNGANGLLDIDPYDTQYVLDSGGYSAMNEFGGEFPWTVKEYHDWLQEAYERRPFDWAAVMDLACEPKFDDTMSVKARQDRTLENTLEHVSLDPDYPLLPVLQGRTIEQWLEYHDRLVDHGVDTTYVGVGTLCRQSSSKQIANIERALRANTDIEAMHGFGVKIASFNHGAVFDSADSQAWSWQTKFGQKYTQTSEDPPEFESVPYEDSAQAHAESFASYYPRAVYLQQKAYNRRKGGEGITTLLDYA